ncbi:hypothetical protein Pan161_05990 [Gimesia algae]|uniref:Uncharacterized protein n=1 Tax=Gimesia algae TaxID=2527971 RepID=A0A517V7K1_9PLAN|nr:hypothetical protein Pan161_05990 [Gimesia algae]
MGAAPTAEKVGNVKLNCVISLTVSCCLRQPRITSGGTLCVYWFGIFICGAEGQIVYNAL